MCLRFSIPPLAHSAKYSFRLAAVTELLFFLQMGECSLLAVHSLVKRLCRQKYLTLSPRRHSLPIMLRLTMCLAVQSCLQTERSCLLAVISHHCMLTFTKSGRRITSQISKMI